ncbi:FtsW/RodA/SpoVE family cell cycle protein [Effusibacillus pohliae]|uniref:FtsW/RodA/SpoVE family cell cycle protein n=1 Tax=Effusibacillus pohliae TaxID=232270 RepID=UPI0014614F07|nr:FtsW/RodA/SpoVE family cell cycle protein [Effusibacillus pohliae]
MERLVSVDWLKRHAKDFDFLLLLVIIGISVISYLAVYSATITRPELQAYHQKQLLWQIFGFAVFFPLVLTDYRIFTNSRLLWIGYAMTMVLLVIALFSPETNGQRSWIYLPGFQLQPSEFGKLFAIMGMAYYMARLKEKEELFTWYHFLRVAGIWLGPFLLIMMEPDLGQGLVMVGLFCAMMMLVLDRKLLRIFGSIAAVFVIGYFVLVTSFPATYLKLVQLLPLKGYQKLRFLAVVDPTLAGRDSGGFQLLQGIIAIGNGQLWGRGMQGGSQTQGAFVPEQHTDMIFTAISEAYGFVGASALLLLYFVMLQRMVKIAVTANDPFGTYFITGALGMFGFQIFENIGMTLLLLPMTGITLPFVSYGGTSLLVNFMIMGIVQSIAIRRRKLRF